MGCPWVSASATQPRSGWFARSPSVKGIGLTEAVRHAVGAELRRLDREPPLRERVAAIRRAILARGRTGERADKAFFDDLSGDL